MKNSFAVVCTALGMGVAILPAGVHAQEAANREQGEPASVVGGAVRLQAIEVSASAPDATGPVGGYVATQSVTATKTATPLIETPQSVSVITRDQMQARDTGTLSDVVRYAAGVQGSPFGFEPRFTFIRIRGFDVTDNALYRNGLKLVNPPVVGGSGGTVSYSLEPYGAQRIVIPRGPVSVLYGQASPGGLVNYISKRPTWEPFREVELEVGSYEHLEGKFDFSGPIDDEGVYSYRLTGLLRDSETQVDYVADDRVFIAPAFTWRPSERTELTLLGHYQEDDTRSSQALPAVGTLYPNPNGQIPVDTFTGEPAIDRYDRTAYSLGYLFEHEFSDRLEFRQKLSHYSVDLDDVSVYASSVQDARTVGRSYFGNFGELAALVVDNQLEIELGGDAVSHVLLAGVDYQHIDLESEQNFTAAPPLDLYDPDYGGTVDFASLSPIADQDGTQDQLGLYLQDRITFDERWILSLGGRYDWARRETIDHLSDTSTVQEDNAFTGRVGLLYRSQIGLSPYVSYSESFLPSLGADADGDPFEPETGEQYEVGVKYQPEGMNAFVTVAAFQLERNNYVQFDPATFTNVQTGQARTRGIEVEGVASLDFGLDIIASYTYLDAEITESAVASEVGNRPRLVPEHQAALWADYTIQGGDLAGLGFGAGVRYLGSVYGDDANSPRSKVPDVTLFDAALHYDWGHYRFQLNVQNVFDKEYVASTFARGGTFFATYGQARTVTAAVRYRW